MKRLILPCVLALLTAPVFAQGFFPVGAWMGKATCMDPVYPWEQAIMDTAKQCGFNVVGIGNMPKSWLQSSLEYAKSRGLKCFVNSAQLAETPPDTRHNIERFAAGVYSQYEAENHPYFIHNVGYSQSGSWVCDSGAAGYAVKCSTSFDGSYTPWVHQNNMDCRMPFGDYWYGDMVSAYTVRFGLKYQGDTADAPVCKISWVKLNDDWGTPQFGTQVLPDNLDSLTADSMMLTTKDFSGPDMYKAFSMKFNRYPGLTRWLDYRVYCYGNRKVYVDYIDVKDAVYDSLVNDWGNVYSHAIHNNELTGIADVYSDTSVVYRFYLRDEPVRSQFSSDSVVNYRLKQVGSNIPGFAIVVPQYPFSFGNRGLTNEADTSFYYEFVNKTNPSQLAVDILPLFGKQASSRFDYVRVPEDSGSIFQHQMDVFCRFAGHANKASCQKDIPWWIQLQSFGDYSSDEADTASEGLWRLPTPRELKCMAYLSLANGAKGVYYYQFVTSTADYSGYNMGSTLYNQLGIVDTFGRVRDTMLYNATKFINANIQLLAPVLLNLTCDQAFRKQDDYIPSGTFITGVSDSLVQMGVLHSKINVNDKYIMLVNRHCLPTDTLTVTVTISNVEPFFITDMLTGQPASGQLPAGANVPFSYKLQPGEGRLFRIVPFTAQIKINQNATYTNFRFVQVDDPASSSLHSVDSVQITQKYYVKTQADTAARPDYISYYWAADTSDWLPYSASAIKYLENSIDNKANIFEFQFKIGGGKILTPKYSSQILFNDVSPVNGAITINNNANFTNTQTVNVKLTGTDVFPGLSQMRFAEAPFGNASGYVNLVKNGTFEDTTNWVLDNAEFYDGFLHLKGVHTGPGPAQIGSSAKQIIPGSEINQHRNKLFRLSDDIYSHDVISSYKYVDVFYADSLFPNGVRLLDKPIASTPEVVWKSSSDTFSLKVDTARPLDRIEISYNIFGIELPPPPPDPGTLFNTIAVDNIRLEPVELKTGVLPDNVPENSYVFDGWDYADTNYSLYYKLSPVDGAKRVYMQLRDLPGNISAEPGWYDDIILDMTKPAVSLDIPLDLSYVNGTVPVCGWSADQNFKDWTLDCQPYASDNWQALSTNTTHVNVNGPYYSMLLYTWNTDMLSDDIYMLRFTANDLAGNARADTHYVQVLTGPDLPAQAITSEFATFNSLPVDATCDNIGNVYVTDTQADKIWKFSPEGDSLLCFGYKYTCQDTLGLNHPKGVAVDDSGNIWITDCYQSKVKKYDSFGNYLSTIGKYGNQQGEFNQPTGITISGNEIYVADHLNGRVQVFNKTGAFIRQFGNNCLNQPAGIAIRNKETEKLVYVCDSQNDRVAIFDTSGNLVNSLDSLGLDKPWDICFDNNNNLYIADVYNNRVIELDPWHNKLLTFGIQGQEAGQFKLPQGLAVSPDGKYLYVADTHNDRLQRFKMFFDMGALGGAQFAGTRQITNSAPTVFGLSQCYPNPCKQETNIKYQIAKQGAVNLKVYNTLGQVVKTLVNENQQPGYYTINWDGRDESTRQVAAGIYFYRLQASSFSSTKKAVVLR